MSKRFKRYLPIVAVIGAVVLVICLVLASGQLKQAKTDTGETRPAVEATLAQLQAMRPTFLDDAGFRGAVEQAAQAPFVAAMWLFAPDGRIVYSVGSMAASAPSGSSAQERATSELQRVLSTLPQDALSSDQQTMLLAASAIQAEGEHNDVYRHMLRALYAPDGAVVGLVGVAYDVSPAVGAPPDLGWVVNLLAALAGLAAYWLALPVWVWLDARERGERAWVWAMFVFVGNLVALMAYILVRSPGR